MTVFAGTASAASFTPGNVVVLRDGAGGATLTSAATATFLDEYGPSGVSQAAPVNTIALPTVPNGTSLAVTDSGSATSDGQITNSGDGQTILVPGYNAPVGTASVASSASASYARVIARVGAGGLVDSTTSTKAFDGNNIRSATSAYLNGSETDVSVGGNSGIQVETEGQSTSSSASASTSYTNLRVVHVYSGQTFVSAGAGGLLGVGLLNAGTNVVTQLPGVTTANSYGFAFARTGTGATYVANGVDTGFDTVYVADASNGLYKFVYNGTSFAAIGSPVAGAFYGLAARTGATPGTEDVFYTTTTSLRKVTDGGTGAITATPVTLATAATNEAFRGVAFTAPTPATSLPEAPYAILLPLIGLTAAGVLYVRSSSRKTATVASI